MDVGRFPGTLGLKGAGVVPRHTIQRADPLRLVLSKDDSAYAASNGFR
jgi:hypothetical protein